MFWSRQPSAFIFPNIGFCFFLRLLLLFFIGLLQHCSGRPLLDLFFHCPILTIQTRYYTDTFTFIQRNQYYNIVLNAFWVLKLIAAQNCIFWYRLNISAFLKKYAILLLWYVTTYITQVSNCFLLHSMAKDTFSITCNSEEIALSSLVSEHQRNSPMLIVLLFSS